MDGVMRLNDAGMVVADEWTKTPMIRNAIELDEWVIMPNHFHGIIVIPCRGDLPVAPGGQCVPTPGWDDRQEWGDRQVAPTITEMADKSGPRPCSIGSIMAGFKSAVTKRINLLRKSPRRPVWQRNYWERVIRNDVELARIREYIQTNPTRWKEDNLHPRATGWAG